MKYTTKEIAILVAALNQKNSGDGNPQARTYALVELADATSAMARMKALSDDNGEIPDGEYELEFNTTEKTLILKCLDENQWMVGDGEFVLSVKEKLN